MRSRVAAIVGLVVALVLGVLVGTAYASTTDELGGFSVDFKQVTETHSSPASGAMMYKAQCPAGYSPIGGGGHAYETNNRTSLLVSAPYDDGNKGWGVMYNVPSSSWTVLVYATCMKIA